jgi:diguanylate cyclase
MKYQDGAEKSAEYLRLSLPLMAQQQAAMHPVSYAVWYNYVAGRNAALSARIDDILKAGKTLDEESTYQLYREHVAEIDEALARQISAGLQKVMADVSTSAEEAGSRASRFGDALGTWSDELANAPAGGGQGVKAILELTRDMQGSIGALRERLDDSRSEIEQLRQEVVKARQEARTDGLTGLVNRRGFESECAARLANVIPDESGPSLLLADIDHFKRINDSYGHLFGDKVLKAVAAILQDNVKGRDTAARYGGEEFIILLPDTPLDGAQHLAEKIRSVVERCRIKRTGDNGAVTNITISIGVATIRPGEAMPDFINRADTALYAAKDAGRNRVTVAD